MSSKDFRARSEAMPLITILFVLLLLVTIFTWVYLFFLGLLLMTAVMFFFRDPYRICPGERGSVYAPADGKVVEVAQVEGLEGLDGKRWKVGIFLSIFNVHINRIPVTGTVRRVIHRQGKHLNALNRHSSAQNEHVDLYVEADDGEVFLVRQIAGIIARRIICLLDVGDRVSSGQKYGMIKFGSRTELFLPLSYRPTVKEGDRVYAGITRVGEKNETATQV